MRRKPGNHIYSRECTGPKCSWNILWGLPMSLMIVVMLSLSGCKDKKEHTAALFKVLDHKATGIDFQNTLTYSNEFNLFKYIYFYNGSGVGAGDFNNDGKIDLFFGSNQGQSKLYLNEGGMKFSDVSTAANIPNDGGWTTGISVVDINNERPVIYIVKDEQKAR